jgi:hypothetical protein
MPPLLIQIFPPFRIQCFPSSLNTARERMEFASEPDVGSVSAKAARYQRHRYAHDGIAHTHTHTHIHNSQIELRGVGHTTVTGGGAGERAYKGVQRAHPRVRPRNAQPRGAGECVC